MWATLKFAPKFKMAAIIQNNCCTVSRKIEIAPIKLKCMSTYPSDTKSVHNYKLERMVPLIGCESKNDGTTIFVKYYYVYIFGLDFDLFC